ncbi:hypothetical protein [Mycobacteroides abscessus]|uniref:hypothetical protein n=1 Tax=unclassified Desemzia TaxID=2685243 RepID=UPI0009A78B86|nr:DNA polymerase III subunit beta [Mycobacteroides abscessus subsp. abscessus]
MELTEKTFNKLQAELKKWFVGNKRLKENRPVLNTIHFTEDGNIEMTNSHVAIRMKDVHEQPEHVVPYLDTSAYPSLERIFNGVENGSFQIELEPKLMLGMLSPFKLEKVEVIKLSFRKDGIEFKPVNYAGNIIQEAKLTVPLNMNEEFHIAVNVKYLYDAMMFFKTQKIKIIKMTASSAVRPMMFEHENLQYLVTPVRIG